MTIDPAPQPARLRGRDAVFALLLGAAAVAVVFDAWRDIYRIAMADEECSYVLIAPVVAGWLVWVRRARLRGCPARAGWIGVIMILAAWAVYWFGYLADPVIWRAGAVGILAGALVAAIGGAAALRLLPAFVAMLFLVPVDPNGRYRIAEPLQTVTSHMTQTVCDVFGIYVERSGSLLTINGVGVTIAEACNGMRMLLTLFLVCYVVAFTWPLRPIPRFLFLAATPIVAVVSNVIRLVPTVWMFGHCSHQAAERFHDVSGWVMTIVAFLALMGFFRLLVPSPDPSGTPRAPAKSRESLEHRDRGLQARSTAPGDAERAASVSDRS